MHFNKKVLQFVFLLTMFIGSVAFAQVFIIDIPTVVVLRDKAAITELTANTLRSLAPIEVTDEKITTWRSARVITQDEAVILRSLLDGSITLADIPDNSGTSVTLDTGNGTSVTLDTGEITTSNSGTNDFSKLVNPLAKGDVQDIPTLVKKLLEIVLKVGAPLIAIAIIYAGYLFIAAQGNPDKLTKAKQTLVYVVIGAAILLGAYVIAESIVGTINAIRGQ